jgi:hypothetical protein
MQPYTINSAKVIFLKPRPQSRPFKGSGNVCLTCDRILQEPFHFCCLSCKVLLHVVYTIHTSIRTCMPGLLPVPEKKTYN